MKFVMRDGPGEVSVSYMWLPAFIGLNAAFMKRLEDEVKPLLIGKELTEETLEVAHEAVLTFIEKAHPELRGLRDYLDAVKFVEGPA